MNLILVKAPHASSIWLNDGFIASGENLDNMFRNIANNLGTVCSSSYVFSGALSDPAKFECLDSYLNEIDLKYRFHKEKVLSFISKFKAETDELLTRHDVVCNNYISIIENEIGKTEKARLTKWIYGNLIDLAMFQIGLPKKFSPFVKDDVMNGDHLGSSQNLVASIFWCVGLSAGVVAINDALKNKQQNLG